MITVVQHQIDGLGHLYSPAGFGPFPGVLLLHGSEGSRGWIAHRDAAMLAARGFVAYPHPYSLGDVPWVGGDIWEVDLDATERAITALRGASLCSGKVGIYGWSRGGEHAILSAALMAKAASIAQPDALAAHAAPDRVQGAWRNLFIRQAKGQEQASPRWTWPRDGYDPTLPAWTWRGQPILPGSPIEIEAYSGPVFLSVGDQDEIWPADMTPRLADRIRHTGRSPEVHVYQGQLHMPDPTGWNRHLDLLVDFFGRHLVVQATAG